MAPDFRFSRQAASLTAELLRSDADWRYGYDLMKATELGAGTLYPLLARLAARGWVETHWEERGEGGRPPRHLYRLTADGARGARALVDEDGRRAARPIRLSGLAGEGT